MRSDSEYNANSEGQFAQPAAVAARRKGQPPNRNWFQEKEVSLADLIHSRARAAAENQLATKRILNIRAAKLLTSLRAGGITLAHSCCGGCKRSTPHFSFRIARDPRAIRKGHIYEIRPHCEVAVPSRFQKMPEVGIIVPCML